MPVRVPPAPRVGDGANPYRRRRAAHTAGAALAAARKVEHAQIEVLLVEDADALVALYTHQHAMADAHASSASHADSRRAFRARARFCEEVAREALERRASSSPSPPRARGRRGHLQRAARRERQPTLVLRRSRTRHRERRARYPADARAGGRAARRVVVGRAAVSRPAAGRGRLRRSPRTPLEADDEDHRRHADAVRLGATFRPRPTAATPAASAGKSELGLLDAPDRRGRGGPRLPRLGHARRAPRRRSR